MLKSYGHVLVSRRALGFVFAQYFLAILASRPLTVDHAGLVHGAQHSSESFRVNTVQRGAILLSPVKTHHR